MRVLLVVLLARAAFCAPQQTSGSDILDAANSARQYGQNGDAGVQDDLVINTLPQNKSVEF